VGVDSMPSGIPLKSNPAEHPVLDRFEGELEHLDRLLSQYEAIAGPFLAPDQPSEQAIPEAVPDNDYDTRVIRFARLNRRFADLNSRLRP
jgi:hypothetical protein